MFEFFEECLTVSVFTAVAKFTLLALLLFAPAPAQQRRASSSTIRKKGRFSRRILLRPPSSADSQVSATAWEIEIAFPDARPRCV